MQDKLPVNLIGYRKILDRGRPRWVEILWLVVQGLLVNCWLPGTWHRAFFLRLFGARVGRRATLRPYLRVKFPWRLTLGDAVWVGESVWIDNLVPVTIGSHVCISQGAYIATGNHDWSSPGFDLVTAEVTIGSYAWLGAHCRIAPGCVIDEGAVVTLNSVAVGHLDAWTIYVGNPAGRTKSRTLITKSDGGPA